MIPNSSNAWLITQEALRNDYKEGYEKLKVLFENRIRKAASEGHLSCSFSPREYAGLPGLDMLLDNLSGKGYLISEVSGYEITVGWFQNLPYTR